MLANKSCAGLEVAKAGGASAAKPARAGVFVLSRMLSCDKLTMAVSTSFNAGDYILGGQIVNDFL